MTNPFWAPSYNTSEDRNRARLRARLGLEADLYDGFTAGLRIGTGSDNSPVSTNQTLGGSGGNFSKYALWLDRAYLEWEPLKNPYFGSRVPETSPDALSLTLGRFDNPFFSTTDLVWDADLGFDGIAVKARREVSPGVTPFVSVGAFPIFNTSLDFATTEPVKYGSEDKYLIGAQVGMNWQARPDVGVTFGAGIFEFSNVEGRRSSPCDLSIQESCDTDHLRPSYAQKGNTYMYLRDVMPPAGWNGVDPYPNDQYFGLATEYRPVVLSGRVDLGQFDPVHVALDGEFVWNSAFDKSEVRKKAINNLGPDGADGSAGSYEGGNIGWMTKLTVGHKKLDAFGKWSVNVGYKYLQSDAVLDAFADSDFGLGGTNLEGYFLGGDLALSENVTASAKWMSADSIAGAPYAVDTFQLDVTGRF
ncbi:putative porin [Aliirhizobium terrae]|nr:putative porin [Rhizobium sp. CC-CFT758]WJH42160.1 putative porin [Rhizobium sp. CC-CFT758]